MRPFKIFFIIPALVVFLLPVFVLAQSNQENIQDENFVGIPDQTSSCFDYYDFGSVRAKLFSEVSETVSGVPLNLNAEVVNNNTYPVVEGDLYVRIYREQNNKDKRTINGDDIVDELLVAENFSLDAGEEKTFSFQWQVPGNIRSGKYYAVSYVVSSDRYNLLGLTFTDDVAGDKTFFNIKGQSQGVFFNKNNVTKNGRPHQFISFISVLNKEAPIKITAQIINTTNKTQEVEIDWNLSWWDASLEDNKISQETKKYKIKRNSRKTVTYVIRDNDKSVYYLNPVLKYEDTKSILNIRMARKGINIPRVNFPAVDKYPLIKNQPTNFFVCLHNAGTAEAVENTLFKTLIKADNGDIINEYQYQGDVTGIMMGLVDTFIPEKDYSNFTIRTEIYKDDVLIDADEIIYSCEDINENHCPKQKNPFVETMIYIISIIFVLYVSVKVLKKINEKSDDEELLLKNKKND